MYHYQPPQHSYHHYHQPSTYHHYQPYYPQHEYPSYHKQEEKHYEYPSYHKEEEKHYEYPSYHKEEEKGGLSTVASLLVPLLGLIGLSLLVPNVVGLRAKRDVSTFDPVDKQAQMLANIYNTVLTSEDCVRRLLCEMGQMAKNAKDKDGLFKLIDRTFPKQFNQEVSIFKEASSASTYTCAKYTCQITPPGTKDELQLKRI